MNTIEHTVSDATELASLCLPFIKNGGIFLTTTAEYSLGSEVQVSLKLWGKMPPIEFTGKVVWSTPTLEQHELPAGIGVQWEGSDAQRVRSQIINSAPLAFATGMSNTVLMPKASSN